MIPESITHAAREALTSSPPVRVRVPFPAPGEVGVIDPFRGVGPRRVALVVDADPATKTLEIMLATTELDMATDLDLILPSVESGLPFSLVVEAELYGPVFQEQLLQGVAEAPEEAVAAVRSSIPSDGESLQGFSVGLPLGGTDDPRRAFRELELEELEALVAECRAWLTGGPSEVSIPDPAMLIPPPTGTPRGTAEDQYLDLLDTLAEVGTGTIEIPSELILLMGEQGLIDEISRWRIDFGLDPASILARVRFTELPVNLSTEVGAEDTGEDVLVSFVTFLARSGTRSIDIHTGATYWRREDTVLVIEEGPRACRARALLKEAA